MFTLLEIQVYRKIWKYSEEFEFYKPGEYYPDDFKVANAEAKKYLKDKKIVRFAFVCDKQNFDEHLAQKEFDKLCKKFGLSSVITSSSVDISPGVNSYTRYPEVKIL